MDATHDDPAPRTILLEAKVPYFSRRITIWFFLLMGRKPSNWMASVQPRHL